MDIQNRDGSNWVFSLPGSKRREKVLRPYPGTESESRRYERCAGSHNPPTRKSGKEMMTALFKTTREWWLVGLCMILLLTQTYPQVIEYVYPILDWKGGNRLNMQVDKDRTMKEFYQCGEVVTARFKLQKQREAVGQIKWELVKNAPEGQVYPYTARVAAAPVGITDHWAPVERLPQLCAPGQYHFAGTISYPVWFGTVIYSIKTNDFEVRNNDVRPE
jgi:hypothetical protein